MDDGMETLREMHIWDLVDLPKKTKILRKKKAYKLNWKGIAKSVDIKLTWLAKDLSSIMVLIVSRHVFH